MNATKTMGLEEWLGEKAAIRLMEEMEKSTKEELLDLRNALESLLQFIGLEQPVETLA